MLNIFIILAFIAVLIGSYTDIKTSEVPDWLSYAIIAIGLAGNLVYTVVNNDFYFIIRSLLGLGLALIIGLLMFYSSQWGGGDSKVLFGLGALLGISYPFKLDFFIMFIVNMLFAGAVYGLAWVIVMALKSRKKIAKKVKKLFQDKKFVKIRIIAGITSIIALIVLFIVPLDSSIKITFAIFIIVLYFMNYALILIKAVEEVSMIKWIYPEKLTEGDWIVDEVKVDGKYITGPKDLGVKKEQIKQLLKLKAKGKIKKIKVKYGIPFVPSFLIAMIYTIITDNIILLQLI